MGWKGGPKGWKIILEFLWKNNYVYVYNLTMLWPVRFTSKGQVWLLGYAIKDKVHDLHFPFSLTLAGMQAWWWNTLIHEATKPTQQEKKINVYILYILVLCHCSKAYTLINITMKKELDIEFIQNIQGLWKILF